MSDDKKNRSIVKKTFEFVKSDLIEQPKATKFNVDFVDKIPEKTSPE